ncbi:hypothetical protein J6590_092702 [Homalodisca vitripennis]|nr:hypothetical protein J6590_092702 [Homalodisca vitripennis]
MYPCLQKHQDETTFAEYCSTTWTIPAPICSMVYLQTPILRPGKSMVLLKSSLDLINMVAQRIRSRSPTLTCISPVNKVRNEHCVQGANLSLCPYGYTKFLLVNQLIY